MEFSTKLLNKIIVGYLFCLLWGCSVDNNQIQTVSAQVSAVISGETLEVMIQNQPTKVRIIGINLPQSNNDSWKKLAKTRLKELIDNQTVNLEWETDELDSYNRLLAHVWYNNILVSEELLKEGLVIANTKYENKYSQRLFHAQEYARILEHGLWQ